MIRGVYCTLGAEVRLKLLHRSHGSGAMQGVWTASDRWLIETASTPRTLLLGVESDRDTRQALRTAMRGDLRVLVTPGGLFREQVQEIIDFDVAIPDLAYGPDFGAFWTMAAGFGPHFGNSLSQGLTMNGSLSRYLHEAPIMHDDGPWIVMYRNFFDDETCVRLRHELWDSIARGIQNEHRIPLSERESVSFDGETYDFTSTMKIDKN